MSRGGAPLQVLFLIENSSFAFDNRVRREARTLRAAGAEVVVIAPRHRAEPWYDAADGIHVYRYATPMPSRGVWSYAVEYGTSLAAQTALTAWVALRHGFDVIHVANPPDLLWLVALPYRALGAARFVFDHHDLVPELYLDRFGRHDRIVLAALRRLERASMALADHVIATNETYRAVAVQRGGKAAVAVTVVRNGPDARDFPAAPPDPTVRALGRIVVGYLGDMNPQDGVERFLEMARLIRHQHGRADVGFVMVGTGASFAAIRRRRDALGLADAVVMTGRLPWPDVLATLRATDICVQPDPPGRLNDRSTMNKLMDYLALGRAVVAHDLPETRVSGGERGAVRARRHGRGPGHRRARACRRSRPAECAAARRHPARARRARLAAPGTAPAGRVRAAVPRAPASGAGRRRGHRMTDARRAGALVSRPTAQHALAELPHRAREAFRRQVDRQRRAPVIRAGGRRAPLPPAFPIDAVALRAASADDRARCARQAADIVGDRLVLLGQRWPPGARTDWALDPASGARWDWDRFCFDVARRHGRGPGDAKLVWELSRLQHLQVLALDAALSGSEVSRAACLADLGAWIEGNPPYRGLAWASGIELACRVVSVLVVTALLDPARIPAPLAGAIWDLLAAHGAWLARYPSLGSSANNHLVAEACALFALGCLAPALPGAPAWRAFGRAHLEREATRQLLADGVGGEQSPDYQACTMEWLLVARHLGRATGHPLAAAVDARLVAGARFLGAILDADGHHPRIGDQDDGVVLRQDLAPERAPLAIAGAVGALLGVGDVCHPRYRLDLRARLLGARALPPPAWRPTSATFAAGGYTVLRAGALLAVLDHGPLGYAHTAAHGHADALALWLHVGGTPLLVDAGTYRYDHDGGWRDHLRGTAAHNTVTVDGLDQSDRAGPFNWGRRQARGRLLAARLDAAPSATARHDGYAHLGVVHERAVSLADDRCRVDDRLRGRGRHRVALTWQFAPGLRLAADGDRRYRVSAADGLTATIEIAGPPAALAVVAQTDRPGPGAVSPAYNRLLAAPALRCECDVALPIELVTTISL
ncbi:MAG: heparinase II/III family protein [Candidatus Binatia bacterium]